MKNDDFFYVCRLGAQTISSRTEWKYVSVRRMALFLEQSILQGLGWAVFKPNDEPLSAQIRQVIDRFLQTPFRQGAFQGAKAEDAYVVKCGRHDDRGRSSSRRRQ